MRGGKGDYKDGARSELGTPTMQRTKIAQQRVRMEGWRQRRTGSNARNPQEGKRKQKEKNTLDSYRPSHGRNPQEGKRKQKEKNTLDSYRPSHGRNPQEGKRKQKEKNTLDSYRPSHAKNTQDTNTKQKKTS